MHKHTFSHNLLKSPMRPYGIIAMISFSLTFITSMLMLLGVENVLYQYEQFRTPKTMGISWYFMMGIGIVGVLLFVYSILGMLSSKKHIDKFKLSRRIPREFKNYNEVETSLRKKEVSYDLTRSIEPDFLIKKIIGEKFAKLTPHAKMVAVQSVSYLKRFSIVAVSVGVIFGVKPLIFKDGFNIIVNSFSFPVVLLITAASAIILKVASLFLLNPLSIPHTDVLEKNTAIKEGSSPNSIYSQIEKSLSRICRERIPNRILKRDAVEDGLNKKKNSKGYFHHQLFFENQPLYYDMKKSKTAYINLYIGLVINLSALIFLMYPLMIYGYGYSEAQLAGVATQIISGIVLMILGRLFFKHADYLMNTIRFESVLVFVDVSGTSSLAESTSKNLMNISLSDLSSIKCNASIKVRVTKVISESYGLSEKRDIIGMFSDYQVSETEEIMKEVFPNLSEDELLEIITEDKIEDLDYDKLTSNLSVGKVETKSKAKEKFENKKLQKKELERTIPEQKVKPGIIKEKDTIDPVIAAFGNEHLSTLATFDNKSHKSSSDKLFVDESIFSETNKETKQTEGFLPGFDNETPVDIPVLKSSLPESIFETKNKFETIVDESEPLKSVKDDKISKEIVEKKVAASTTLSDKQVAITETVKTTTTSENDTKICPDCGEEIKAKARICRYCRYEFRPKEEANHGAVNKVSAVNDKRSNLAPQDITKKTPIGSKSSVIYEFVPQKDSVIINKKNENIKQLNDTDPKAKTEHLKEENKDSAGFSKVFQFRLRDNSATDENMDEAEQKNSSVSSAHKNQADKEATLSQDEIDIYSSLFEYSSEKSEQAKIESTEGGTDFEKPRSEQKFSESFPEQVSIVNEIEEDEIDEIEEEDDGGEKKICPKCGKEVKAQAIICMHCQHEFVADRDLWKILQAL